MSQLTSLEQSAYRFMDRYGLTLLRVSIGIIFLWFGVLKFFPGASPAQELAINTISTLTFDVLPENVIIVGLAIWETLIGLAFLFNRGLRVILPLFFLQMLGTFLPLFFFPGESFTQVPYAPTLEGQYIIKNLVLVSAAMVVGAASIKEREG